MATSSERAYTRSTTPRASAPVAVHCWPVPPRETLKHSSGSVSVGSLGPAVHKVCLSPLSISGRYGVWFQMQFHPSYHLAGASLMAQRVKHLSAMQETWVQSLGWEDPLEKKMAAHSSIFAWKIPWTAQPGRLPSLGSQSQTWLSDFTILLGLLLCPWTWGISST